jgi:enolase
VLFGSNGKPTVEVGVSCVYQGKIVPSATSRIGTEEEWRPAVPDPKEGEGCKTKYEVVAELVESSFSQLIDGILTTDQAAVDVALVGGATATAARALVVAAAAAADPPVPCEEPEASTIQQIQAEALIVTSLSFANFSASAIVTKTEAFERAMALSGDDINPAATPQLAFPIFNCDGQGGKLKIRGAMLTAPINADAASAARLLCKTYNQVKESLSKKVPAVAEANGAFPLKADKIESLLEPINDALKQVGAAPGAIQLVLDAGIPYLADKQKFEMVMGGLKSADEQVTFYAEIVTKNPVVAGIIDPFPLAFPEAWSSLREALADKCFVAGGSSCSNSVDALVPTPASASEAASADGADGAEAEASACTDTNANASAAGDDNSEGIDTVAAPPFGGSIVLSLSAMQTVSATVATVAAARCALFGRNLHSRMPLDPTHVRLKRTCVRLMAFLSEVHSSYRLAL